MKPLMCNLAVAVLLAAGTLAGCSATNESPDVSGSIRKSLDQAGLRDVSVSQDREKGVVTLSGHVPADTDKERAESIARSMASGQVVSDEVAVTPSNERSEMNAANSDTDKAIDKNIDAALIRSRMKTGVSYNVKNGVVTLTGNVNSQARRAQIEKIAAGVPNVKQVVNELDVKHQKATSSSKGS